MNTIDLQIIKKLHVRHLNVLPYSLFETAKTSPLIKMYLALQELATNGVFEIFTGDQRNKLVKQTNSSDSTTTKSLQELERLGLITIWKQSTKKQQPGYKTVFITYNFNMGEDLLVDCDKEEIRLNKKYHRNLQRKSDKVLRKKINEGNLDIPIPYFNS